MTVHHELEKFEVVSYQLDEDRDHDGDSVGIINLKYLNGEVHEHSIWNDSEGNYYFCNATGEIDDNDEDVYDDFLLSDFTDYVAPQLCPICLTNELDLDEEMNAICRKDDSTVICSDCGQKQAMEELGL